MVPDIWWRCPTAQVTAATSGPPNIVCGQQDQGRSQGRQAFHQQRFIIEESSTWLALLQPLIKLCMNVPAFSKQGHV